ncbi:MAG: threonine synthase [Burkholderiales bacterium]
MSERYAGLIPRFREYLPVSQETPVISLCEGNTPLIELRNIPRIIGSSVRLWAKFEGLNPTGSFKDRGMTVAVSKAMEEGAWAVICASTGNTSASAAAYASRAGIACYVLIPEGKIAQGKLSQAMMHGATVIQIQGNFDDGMRLVQEVAESGKATIVNSINPFRIQGQKTIVFEIIEALGEAPDYHALPVGNAGNITAHWIGYCEASGAETKACSWCAGKCPYKKPAQTGKRPVMLGYQAAGAAPFLCGEMIKNPETIATAIRIGHPMSWQQAWQAQEESGGWFSACSDEEILAAQKLLADKEGIFCEPASATALAGVLKDLEGKRINEGATVVCTLTGHGLKDPDTAIAQGGKLQSVAATREAIERVLK